MGIDLKTPIFEKSLRVCTQMLGLGCLTEHRAVGWRDGARMVKNEIGGLFSSRDDSGIHLNDCCTVDEGT